MHSRSRIVLAAAAALLLLTGIPFARAQTPAWPTKTIKYIVPFSPGGVSDNVARLVAQHLGENLGRR